MLPGLVHGHPTSAHNLGMPEQVRQGFSNYFDLGIIHIEVISPGWLWPPAWIDTQR
jgi:hypothetical protein